MATKIPVLFELMSRRKIKQKQLSDSIGVSEGNISDWKSGRSSPSVEVLPKIADYLDCSVDYLIGRTNDPQAPIGDNKVLDNHEYLEIVKLLQSLSPEDFNLVKRLIEQLVSKQIPPSPKNDGETKT